MKNQNIKLNLTLDQLQELDLLVMDSLLRYEEADDKEASGYKKQKQIAGRINTALKRALK